MKWYLGKALAVLGLALLTWTSLSRSHRVALPPRVDEDPWDRPRYRDAMKAPNYWFWATLGVGFVASLASMFFF